MLIKGTSRIYIFVLLILAGIQSDAQNLTQSPYSVIGIGEMHFSGSSQLTGIGQTSQGYRRPFEINNLNPASYSSLQQTVFEAGFLYGSGTLSNSSSSAKFDNASFAYFNFAVPISQKHGISLIAGIQPYSSIGYNVSSSKVYATDTATHEYIGTTAMQGRGGISKFYIGSSYKLHKNLSLGFNVNYLFGAIERTQQLMFDTSYHKFNVSEERQIFVSDFNYQIGVQYHKSISEKYKINVGLTYGLMSSLASTSSYTSRTLGWGSPAIYTLDSNYHTDNAKGNIIIPQSIKAGFAFENKGVWLVAADVNYTQWSTYKSFGVGDDLKDNISISLGASIIPNQNALKNYLNKIEYRAGLRYDNGNVKLYNQDISSMAISGGLGIPLGKSKSKLNLGLEYATKGTTNSGLIKEDVLKLVLGVTFSDQWFVRYKYD